MVDLDAYISIIGKIMYYATNIAPEICNAVRQLTGHLDTYQTQENDIGKHWSNVLVIWQVKE
jgi:hypothetical protein